MNPSKLTHFLYGGLAFLSVVRWYMSWAVFTPMECLQNFCGTGGTASTDSFGNLKQQRYTAWYDPQSIAYHTVSTKRMTLDYLCQRSYNEGISDSYNEIREVHGLYVDQIPRPDRNKPKSMAYFVQRARDMSTVDWLRSLQNCIQGFRQRLIPTEQERILRKLQFAYHAGWKFHQSAVQADPELLAFVLKKNYLD